MARGGYVWWYVDALSDDGRHGLTIIAFIGSVFSPYYVWDARQDPFAHCAINVVLYGADKRFAMTERNARSLARDATSIAIGPSSLQWDGSVLTIHLDERSAPIPRALRGTVRVRPQAITAQPFTLDSQGLHRWWPMAPSCEVEAAFTAPDLAWRGSGYLDTNDGDGRLEDAFTDWTWCRASMKRGSAILYDVRRKDGSGQNLTLRFDGDGRRREMPAPLAAALPRTSFWKMPRATRSDDGQARVVETFEDTPFYARSLLASTLDGEQVRPVHESLSLGRFRHPAVQFMLPFRMPRRIA